jgi:hypothetical protein
MCWLTIAVSSTSLRMRFSFLNSLVFADAYRGVCVKIVVFVCKSSPVNTGKGVAVKAWQASLY